MPRKKKTIEVRHFVVEGRPQVKQRPRMFHGVAYTPQATKDYELKMRRAYTDVHGEKTPFECDLAVNVFIFFQKKNHGDCDNYIKTLDGLNAVAWKDDKQIKEIHGSLIVDKNEPERMEIFIRPIEEKWVDKIKKLLSDKLSALQTR